MRFSDSLRNQVEDQLDDLILSIELNSQQGNVNKTFLVQTATSKYILQTKKDIDIKDINQYLVDLYTTAGFYLEGNSFRFRNYNEKAEFHKQCNNLKLKVPKLYGCGENYLLTEYIEGTNYIEYSEILSKKCLFNLFRMIQNAHSNNIILGDRWGGNTMISPLGEVYFIDFDIQYTYDDIQQLNNCKNFEIAVLTYDLILYGKNRIYTLDIIIKIFTSFWFEKSYDVLKVIDYLYGYSRFYTSADKPFSPTSLSIKEHIDVLRCVDLLKIAALDNYRKIIV